MSLFPYSHTHPFTHILSQFVLEDLNEWFKNHGKEQTRPPLDKVIAGLKARGITTFGAAGFCLGAPYTFDLAIEGGIKAAVISHPSAIGVPEFERYAKTSVPLLVNSCEVDPLFPVEMALKGDEILGGGRFAPGYERTYWEGVEHGFTVSEITCLID